MVTFLTMIVRSTTRRYNIFAPALLLLAALLALPEAESYAQAPAGAQKVQMQGSKFVIARLKYEGGGDWYNDPSSELNMLRFLQQHSGVDVDVRTEEFVEVGSEKLFSYPFAFMTGHGSIRLT